MKFKQAAYMTTDEVERLLREIAEIKGESNKSALIRESIRQWHKTLQKESA